MAASGQELVMRGLQHFANLTVSDRPRFAKKLRQATMQYGQPCYVIRANRRTRIVMTPDNGKWQLLSFEKRGDSMYYRNER